MARILVAEDSPTQAAQLRHILEAEAFEVTVVPDGRKALEALAASAYDLVLSDVVMPELDGYEFCRVVKDDPALRDLPVILLTSLSDPMDIIRGLECGADNFLTKPIEPANLVNRIRSVLAHRSLRVNGRLNVGAEILVLGRRLTITSDKDQILGLLVSTFEEVLKTNRRLQASEAELRAANAKNDEYARMLEGRIRLERAMQMRLLEQANDAVLLLDLEGKVLVVNRQGESMLCLSAAEIVGRSFEDFVPATELEVERAQFRKLLAERGVRYNEARLQVMDGRVVWVDYSASVVDVEGERLVLVIMRDTTERRRAQVSLRESEERYRHLFEGNPHVMWVYDPATLDILAANDAAAERYGYGPKELLAMKITDIWRPDEVPRLHEVLTKPPGRLHRSGVWKHRCKDGSILDMELTSHELVFMGRRARLVLAVDVTERRRMEQRLRQSDKMEAVRRLAGGVAHDFNNLLTVINGYGELALRSLPPSTPAREFVRQMVAAGDRAASLTSQLLAFSRNQVLEPRILYLDAAMREAEKMLRRLIGEDIDLVVLSDKDIAPVLADPSQVQQILLNLCVNARDAMPRGGKLTIETRNVELAASYIETHPGVQPGPHVLLSVSDDGHGMTEEVKARVFEPFFTTKETGKGSGIGLATVYGVVLQSQGHISVSSEIGQGTTFRVYFPRARATAPAEGTKSSRSALLPSARGKETVLLAEDDESVRALTRTVLQGAGYTVLEARDGKEALRVCRDHTGIIQLVISDVVMPHLGGRQLTDQIAALRPGIRTLFMSGYTDDAVLMHGVQHAEVQFLQKPFYPTVLVHKVREVLDAE